MSGKGGLEWDWKTYSWIDGDPQLVTANTSEMCDAVDPDLADFKERGGKIIHYAGWADNSTGAFSTVKYFDAVLGVMGSGNTDSFYRLYMVPGMGHCGGGLGCGNVDWQTYIENWVEKDQKPGTVIGSRPAAGSPDNAPDYMSARTRPLCPYPKAARYLGTGSIDEASNFVCVEIISTDVVINPGQMSLENESPSTFTASIELPYRGEWQAVSAVCEGAAATELTRKGRSYRATFNKGDLKNLNPTDEEVFTVTLFTEQQGSSDGVPVVIEGSDKVKIMER